MKVLTIGAALCLSLVLPGKEYATQYTADQSLRIEWESEVTVEMSDFEVVVDGEVMDTSGFGEQSSTISRSVSYVDTVLEAKDGAPTKLTRHFESLSGSSASLSGENERTRESECPLEDVTLQILVDEDGDIITEVKEGIEPEDEGLLEGHHLRLPFDVFLPEDEVGETDEWKLDGDAILEGLLADLDGKLFPPPPRAERGERGERGGRGGGGRGEFDGMQRGQRGGRGMRGGANIGRMFSEGSWEGQASLAAESEEYEGVDCAVIELELKCAGELPETERGEGGRGDRGGADGLAAVLAAPAFENSFSIELEGKLYYSLKDQRPIALELEGELETSSSRVRERGESIMEMTSSQTGELRYSASILPADEEAQAETVPEDVEEE